MKEVLDEGVARDEVEQHQEACAGCKPKPIAHSAGDKPGQGES